MQHTAAGPDLTDPEAARRFLEGWSRMAGRIWQAIEAGHDPFTTPLFAAGAEFARERTFLSHDQEVYRQDVQRGERWLVRLPDGPPEGAVDGHLSIVAVAPSCGCVPVPLT